MHYQLVLIISQISVTITCGIQPTNVVTMAVKVLHNSCNMCTLDLTDMYALALEPLPLRPCIHISQITRAHVTTIT